jgi:peptidoglycan-N-acetylglucosamine deacetylase
MAKAEIYITTSWDDGHPLDLRVAEMLMKHGLKGTFYVPRTAPTETMTEGQIRDVSGSFEIGAHTLDHVVLTRTTEHRARREIMDSKSWIESTTGKPCVMFCAPEGKFAKPHLEMVRRAGYLGLRSVELGSLEFPRRQLGVLVMPTSLQAYPHGFLAFAKNAIKRRRLDNFWRFVTHGRSSDWPALAASFLSGGMEHGGVFHLWGHSWELEATAQWRRLDEALHFLSGFTSAASALTNGSICRMAAIPCAHSAEATRGAARPI